jgi:beta-lactamase class D
MAFNQSIIISPNTVFKWDGRKRELPTWDQDQTPYSWIKYSTVWVSQRITPQLGYARIKHYLAGFDYGNQDFSGDPGKHNGLTEAWLSSSLKISAVEQLNFLNAMLSYELPVSHEAVNNIKKNLYLGKLDNGLDYYGKTGSGRHKDNKKEASSRELRDAWFIGFIDNRVQHYTFVSNLSDKVALAIYNKSLGSAVLMPITIKLLNNFFLLSKS